MSRLMSKHFTLDTIATLKVKRNPLTFKALKHGTSLALKIAC